MRSPYALVLSFALGSAAVAQSPVPPGAPAPVEPIAAGQPAASPVAEPPADPEAKRIAQRLLESTPAGRTLAEAGIRVGGWTQMSYTASSTSRSNLPVTFNTDANAFQMNQNFLRVEKVIDPAKKEVQFGFRTETILPGTDARLTLARGLFDGQLRDGPGGGPRRYPIDLYQAYTEVFLPGIAEGTTVRVGKFATHCEYELVQGAETPFLSRSYLFQYNPFTHTGVWVTTQLTADWSVSNGLAVGSDNFIDPANRLTYLGQVKWAPAGGATTVLLNAVVTNPRFDVAEAFAFYNVYNAQVIHKLTPKLTYVFDAAFSHMDNVPGAGRAGGLGSAAWYGAANYLLWQVTETVGSNLRVELFEDSKGVRTGTAGLYTAVTYGLSWTPKEALLVRPFVRYDTNSRGRPFEGDRDLFTTGLDLIVRW